MRIMKFSHYDLGHQEAGRMVVVDLSGEANVRLMDDHNLNEYRRGRRHRYYGGHVTASPCHIPIPSAGRWHLVIDTGGAPEQVSASVRVENALFTQST